ncbi:hypothetical protein ACFL2K_01440 [Candidatus Margulisiibacteriota bacterium]
MKDLSFSIDKIKAKDVLSDTAIKAKENYIGIKEELKKINRDQKIDSIDDFFYENEDENDTLNNPTRNNNLSEINKNLKLLQEVFITSNFDELIYFLANPAHVLGINFFSGLVKGLGFCIGFLLVLIITAFLLIMSISPNTFEIIIKALGI